MSMEDYDGRWGPRLSDPELAEAATVPEWDPREPAAQTQPLAEVVSGPSETELQRDSGYQG